MIQYIKSLLYIAFMVVSVILFAFAILVIFWSPYSWRYRVAQAWCGLQLWVLKHVLGLDYVIEGRENIPPDPCVVYWKHTSSWETFLTLLMWPKQCWVLKQELTFIPIFGWALRLIEPIAINRRGGRSAVRQVIEKGGKKLREGCWINIFPEGTRVAPDATKRYGISGALLAKETNTLILPIAHNAGDLWPRHSILKRPGRIIVRIGPPIDGADMEPEQINLAAQAWIEGEMERISAAYRRRRER
ncbi:MAG TPA: lysophospholipid acyltransferase family protein [Gammaproteobacteria bacterium]|nr:lysophospholipid acyltransferase family protein [Gammaproteobacteria bacterium]